MTTLRVLILLKIQLLALLDNEILMKDTDGHIVLFNVNYLNITVLAKNTTQVSFLLFNFFIF